MTPRPACRRRPRRPICSGITDSAERLSGGRTAHLRLGFLAFALTGPARELLTAYGRRHPDVEIELRQYEWDDPSAGLLSGAVDMAIVRTPFTGADRLRSIEHHREPVMAALPDGHPLSRLDTIPIARLAAEPFVETTLVRDPTFAAYWYLCDLRTSRPVVSRFHNCRGTAGRDRARPRRQRGASFADEHPKPGLAFVPIEGFPSSRTVLAWDPTATNEPVRALARLAAREAKSTGRH